MIGDRVAMPLADRIAVALAGSITKARIKKGITQADLARRIDVTYGAVSRWEAGTRRPSIDNLVVLAAALGTTFGALTACLDRKERSS